MKLRKLHIEDYKMFKDFDISFVDENDKPLDIVVLAGVNGTGKTTLLECLMNTDIEVTESLNNSLSLILKREENPLSLRNNVNRKLFDPYNYEYGAVYILAGSDKIENIKDIMLQKYIDRAFEIDKPSEALKELQDFIENTFHDLDLTFNLSSINYNKKEVLFKNDNGVEFDIDDLSTGEKTLLSKVLYLYFEGYKDKVILIDEPELSLHPSWQNKVLQIYENFAKQNNCQIIIATHSPHIIGSAKSEYLRILKKVDDKIEVEKYTQSYGLEFDKILTDIMGVENLRTPAVAKDIKKLWKLLEDEAYEGEEYLNLYNKLEELLGSLDKDMVLARLEIARIKSRNAKS